MYTIVNWLLTRRCNLSCNYCNIVKDYVTSPYKSVFEYKENSLSDNKKIIDHIMFINKNAFFILYGGEPTLYYELPELIDYMNEKNCNYTIISNMTGIVRKKYMIY